MILCCSSIFFASESMVDLDLEWSLLLRRPTVLPKLDLLAIEAVSAERFSFWDLDADDAAPLCSWRDASTICIARDLSTGRLREKFDSEAIVIMKYVCCYVFGGVCFLWSGGTRLGDGGVCGQDIEVCFRVESWSLN